MQIQTNNTKDRRVIEGCLAFLRAYDWELSRACTDAINEVGVTEEAQMRVNSEGVYLPASLFANAVTEHIVYQILVGLNAQGKLSQETIDEFVQSTRVAPFIWDLEIVQE